VFVKKMGRFSVSSNIKQKESLETPQQRAMFGEAQGKGGFGEGVPLDAMGKNWRVGEGRTKNGGESECPRKGHQTCERRLHQRAGRGAELTLEMTRTQLKSELQLIGAVR